MNGVNVAPPGRSISSEQPLRVCFDRFELDEAQARITLDGQPVPLPPKPFEVLCALARAPQKLLSSNELLDRVWGHRFVSESVLKSAISDLRAVLRDHPKQPRYIETVSRRGYRFVANLNAPGLPSGTTSSSCFAAMPSSAPASIGRADELERLRAAWRQANSGERQIVCVGGEAGVGKSTLIERFTTDAGTTRSAHGQCVEQQGMGEPYLPILEALTALCRQDAELAGLIRAVAPSWLVRLPWLCTAADREAMQSELSGAGEARMLREMGELLDRYTLNRPLLLVTEDLHWSDAATVQLINYIARRRGPARLLWLASYRLTDIIAADHPFNSVRRELRLHGLCEEIVLDAFSQREVGEYVASRLPALALSEGFVRTLHDRTDGLPLFVAELVDDLATRKGSSVEDSARLNAAWPIPESLAGIVERYLDQLRPDQRLALEAASVCGTVFRVTTLARMLDVDVVALAELCADLVRSHRWLREDPVARFGLTDERYAFRHAIYREVVYKRMGGIARAAYHCKFAAAVGAEGGDDLARGDPAQASASVETDHEHAAP
jgi:DNA-binding winged helix-turn-helix (wHTH) protein